MGEVDYVLGTEIICDCLNIVLTLSKGITFKNMLKLFDMIMASQSTLPFARAKSCPVIKNPQTTRIIK